jgi:hypothetical protein
MTARDFRADCFERQPHLQQGALRERVFAWPDVDELLHRIEPIGPAFQLFSQGLVPEERIEIGTLEQRLPEVSKEALHYALLDLAQHEVISMETCS